MLKEILPPETATAFLVMQELRPQLRSVEQFTAQVDQAQRPAGYRLVGAFDADEDAAVAVIGFRLGHSLSWGRFLYVDDLSSRAAARRRGLARQLLDWVSDEATRLDCAQVHLDSGVGGDRLNAHRLYLNAGYRISAHHFVQLMSEASTGPPAS